MIEFHSHMISLDKHYQVTTRFTAGFMWTSIRAQSLDREFVCRCSMKVHSLILIMASTAT